jgi:hypothetical protein
MPELVQPKDMPALPGLAVPYDFYWVLQHPSPLAGMPYPSARTPWHDLAAAGFRHIICNPSPLTVSQRASLQDLYGGNVPRDPEQEEGLTHEAAHVVVSKLQAGEGVVGHCAGGTGRTGTVIGCVLRVLGVAAVQMIIYLDHLHQARGKSGWPESEWQSQVVRRFS